MWKACFFGAICGADPITSLTLRSSGTLRRQAGSTLLTSNYKGFPILSKRSEVLLFHP